MRQVIDQPTIDNKPLAAGKQITTVQMARGYTHHNGFLRLVNPEDMVVNGGTVTQAQVLAALTSVTNIQVICNSKIVQEFNSVADLQAYNKSVLNERPEFYNDAVDNAYSNGLIPFYFETPKFKDRRTQEATSIFYGTNIDQADPQKRSFYVDPQTKTKQYFSPITDFRIKVTFLNAGIALPNMSFSAGVQEGVLPPFLLRRQQYTPNLQNVIGKNTIQIPLYGSASAPVIVQKIEIALPWRANQDALAVSTEVLKAFKLKSGTVTIVDSNFYDNMRRAVASFYSDESLRSDRLVIDFSSECWGDIGDYLLVTDQNQLTLELDLLTANASCEMYITDFVTSADQI